MSFAIEQIHAKTWYIGDENKMLLKDYTMGENYPGYSIKIDKARTTDTWIWIVKSCSNNVCRGGYCFYFYLVGYAT